jgi:ribonucleoside-triphosphate reductase
MLVLDRIRFIIKRNIEKGLLPNYSYNVINLEKQTTTNGLTAMFEAIKYMGLTETDELGNISYSKEGIDFASLIMDTVNNLQDNVEFDYNVSLEIIPAESANVKLCRKDNLIYNRNEDFIYSNLWTSLMAKSTMQQRIKLSSILDKKAGGGQILHIGLDGARLTEETSWKLLNDIANSGVIYFAFNPKLSLCDKSHTFYGDTCPICGGKKVDEVTRIVGYLVPTSTYSSERKHEYEERKWYEVGSDF